MKTICLEFLTIHTFCQPQIFYDFSQTFCTTHKKGAGKHTTHTHTQCHTADTAR